MPDKEIFKTTQFSFTTLLRSSFNNSKTCSSVFSVQLAIVFAKLLIFLPSKYVIDTSNLSVKQLREELLNIFEYGKTFEELPYMNKKVMMKVSYLDKYYYVTNIKDKYHFIVYEDKMFNAIDGEIFSITLLTA